MEAANYSEKSVTIYKSMRRHVSEDFYDLISIAVIT